MSPKLKIKVEQIRINKFTSFLYKNSFFGSSLSILTLFLYSYDIFIYAIRTYLKKINYL